MRVPAAWERFEMCPKEVSKWACMREVGHEGPCACTPREASQLDGVCFYCRRAEGHEENCPKPKWHLQKEEE